MTVVKMVLLFHLFIIQKTMLSYIQLLLLLCLGINNVSCSEIGDDFAIRPEDQDWLNGLFYLPSEPRVRKEYRMLSDIERNSFHNAFLQMKRDTSVNPNKYDLLASLHHRSSSRNTAHRGTGFLGWHRVFVLLFENAMREKVSNLTMPYWDCTLDAALEDPSTTSLFSEDFMGNGDGYLDTGVFKDWPAQNGVLSRNVGALFNLLEDKNITRVLKQDYIGNISYPMSGKDEEIVVENIHNRVHHWIGGDMIVIETAADDPIFYPYHTFVSHIWQEFRNQQRSKGINPELDWDEHYGKKKHNKYSPMGLGNLMAIDGNSEIFAENIVFTKRPSCSRDHVDCGTPYLYCNVTVEKCAPWTIEEYRIIKAEAQKKKKPFIEAAIPFVRGKLKKGYIQVSELINNTSFINESSSYLDADENIFNILEEKRVARAYQRQEREGYGYGYYEHKHKAYNHSHENTSNIGKPFIKETTKPSNVEYWSIYVFAALIMFRIVFSSITKCLSEKCRNCKSKRMYNTDGTKNNANFNKDGKNGNTSGIPANRNDNIYVITYVTQNSPTQGCDKSSVCLAHQVDSDNTERIQMNHQENISIEEKECNKGNDTEIAYSSHYSREENDIKNQDVIDQTKTASNKDENNEFGKSNDIVDNVSFDFLNDYTDDGECRKSIDSFILHDGESLKSVDSYDLYEHYDNIEVKREALNKNTDINKTCDDNFTSDSQKYYIPNDM